MQILLWWYVLVNWLFGKRPPDVPPYRSVHYGYVVHYTEIQHNPRKNIRTKRKQLKRSK